MRKKKIFAIAVILMLLVSFVAGCGSNAGDNSANNAASESGTDSNSNEDKVITLPAQTESEENTDDAEESTAEEETEPASIVRDVINVGIAADLGTWDPFYLTSQEGRQGVYQSLGYFINGEFFPCLMKSYEFNDDMTAISCELFDNIYDSNGVHMTASDVIYSYTKASEGTTLSVGNFVSDVVETGEYTFDVQFTTTLQVGRLDKLFKFYIVTQESYEASPDHMATDPVGTGPLKVADIVDGYSVTLEARDDYWQTDESKRCYLDRTNAKIVNYYVIPESVQRAIALENGSVDMVTSLNNEELESIRANDKLWLYAVMADKSMDCVPNCDEVSPMNDINLRLAMFYAINPEAIVTAVYNGAAEVNHSFGPSWSTGYQEKWDDEDNYFNVYDPDLAKEYLDKANYNGEKLKMVCQSGSNSASTAQIVMGFLEEVGIKTEIVALERNVFNSYLESADQWDIAIFETACNTYWIDAANGDLTQEKTSWGSSQNYVYDDELQNMLKEYMAMNNYSDENNDKIHNYIINHAYWYSMVNYESYMIMPDWCSAVAMNNAKRLYAAGCYFTE